MEYISIVHINCTCSNNDNDHLHYTELVYIKDCFIFEVSKSLDI